MSGMGWDDYYDCPLWQFTEEELAEHDKDIKINTVDECIKVMKYCWYNGQQPLNVLVSRLEQIKENNI